MKRAEEVMEILEAFDLTGSLRAAAGLAARDHKTVAHWVEARDAAGSGLPMSVRPRPAVDPFAEKVEELVDRSRGRIRADKVHERLVALGLPAGPPAVQGRLGGDGQDREGRLGADRSQPALGLCRLRRARA